MIDDMTDEQFMEFSFLMMTITSDIDDNWTNDEEIIIPITISRKKIFRMNI